MNRTALKAAHCQWKRRLLKSSTIDPLLCPTLCAAWGPWQDRSGLTPEEHAIRNGHHTVASWFRQHLRLVNTRGGSGAAYYEAMQDESAVVKVQWHQIEWLVYKNALIWEVLMTMYIVHAVLYPSMFPLPTKPFA